MLVMYNKHEHVKGSDTSTNPKYMIVHDYSKVVYIKGLVNIEFNIFNRGIFIIRFLILAYSHLDIII